MPDQANNNNDQPAASDADATSQTLPESPATPATPATPDTPATPETPETALRNSLKRCSPATVDAALQFRATRDPALVPAIVIGIIERFTEPDLRPKLHAENLDDIRLIDDLGVDSLTMMEIVILVEEVLQVQIRNEELRDLRTIGDIKIFVDCKLRGLPPPAPARHMPIEEIVSLMPMQPPFLFLNEAKITPATAIAAGATAATATAKYKITGDEFFLQGHFKDNPVMPASMMLEALGQLAVLAILAGALPAEAGYENRAIDPKTIYFTSTDGVRCHRVCKPSDLLQLTVKLKRAKMPLATFEGAIRVGAEKAVLAEEITLTYGYADTPAAAATAALATAAPAAEQTPAASV